MKMYPKPTTWKSEGYKAWLREQKCSMILPGCLHGPCDPHHAKTQGSGGSDGFALSACRFCHSRAHAGMISKEEQFRIAILQRDEWLLERGIK